MSLYGLNFIAKTFAIPLAIGIVTFVLTDEQQKSAVVVASRQKLAQALSEVDKVKSESRRAYTALTLMALPNSKTVPAQDLKDAVIKLDAAISSFGATLGPFEEFARRTGYYKVEPHKPSPLRLAWDKCFVDPYWGFGGRPGYFHLIKQSINTCNDGSCPKNVAIDVLKYHDEFYKGYCNDLKEENGKRVESLPLKYFDRELMRISIQQLHDDGYYYIVGEE